MLEQGQRLAWIGGTTVGTPSGQSLPFFRWDLSSGDWRAVHFIGLHALQAMALLAWFGRRAKPTRSVDRWVMVGAWAYAVLFAVAAVWTALGHSILATAVPGWWGLSAPGLLFALSVAVILGSEVRRRVD